MKEKFKSLKGSGTLIVIISAIVFLTYSTSTFSDVRHMKYMQEKYEDNIREIYESGLEDVGLPKDFSEGKTNYEESELEITSKIKYYLSDGTEVSVTDDSDYAKIELTLNKKSNKIKSLRYVKGEYTESYFTSDSSFGTNILDTYDSTANTYLISENITANQKYTVYGETTTGKKDLLVIDVVGVGSHNLTVSLLDWAYSSRSTSTASTYCDFNLRGYVYNKETKKATYFDNISYTYDSSNQYRVYKSEEFGEFTLDADRTEGNVNYEAYLPEIFTLTKAIPGNIYVWYVSEKINGYSKFDKQSDDIKVNVSRKENRK